MYPLEILSKIYGPLKIVFFFENLSDPPTPGFSTACTYANKVKIIKFKGLYPASLFFLVKNTVCQKKNTEKILITLSEHQRLIQYSYLWICRTSKSSFFVKVTFEHFIEKPSKITSTKVPNKSQLKF